MLLLVSFLLLSATAEVRAQAPGRAGGSPLTPDTVIRVPGMPTLAVLGDSGDGVAALRLSIPLVERPVERGAGELLVALARRRMEGLARRIEARVTAERTGTGLAYGVVGAEVDIEYLLYILRVAAGEPDADPTTLDRARQRLRADIERKREDPRARLLTLLRAQVEADGSSGRPAQPRADGLDAALLTDLWRRSHRAETMFLVVSSGSSPEVLLSALGEIGAPGGPTAAPPDAPALPEAAMAPPPVLRAWYGRVYHAGAAGDPRAEVMALLLSEHLADGTGRFETTVRLWDLGRNGLLTLTGSARPRDRSVLREALTGGLGSVRASLTPESVARAVGRVRWRYLMDGRTAEGRVAIVGRGWDAGGDPAVAAKMEAQLVAIDFPAIATYMDGVLASPALDAELRR
jgi:hypothetical protein